MSRPLIFIALLTIFVTQQAHCHEVLILQSLRNQAYDEAVIGFKSVCASSTKKMVLSELTEMDLVRVVNEEKPELILAVGTEALTKAKKIRQIPIIYLMVLNPMVSGSNITGVSMTVPPERQIDFLKNIAPMPKRIGVLYSQQKSATYVKIAQQVSQQEGFQLIAREIRSPKEVPAMLQNLQGKIDIFWMLPDPNVVTHETVEFMLLFSQRAQIPVLAFAGKYVEMGAIASLDIDFLDMGKQAGEMAKSILEGTAVNDVPRAFVRKTTLKVNRKVANKLGITLGEP